MLAEPRTQLTYFSEKVGVSSKYGPPSSAPVKLTEGEKAKGFRYSPNGKYLAVMDSSCVRVYTTEPFQLKLVINEVGVADSYLSPLGSYLVTWQRPDKEYSKETLKVWLLDDGSQLAGWKLRTQLSWPTVQWTSDELVAGALLQTGTLTFYPGQRFATPLQTLTLSGLTQFSISPGTVTPYKVATFVPGKGDHPGSATIFLYPQVNQPVARKNFYADSVDFLWNSTSSAVLFIVNQDIDKTGKSYYGKKALILLHSDGSFEQRVTDESIHDVKWNPNGKEFAVVYGDMPDPKISTYDLKCKKTADLAEPNETRNTLLYDPTGRILCIGGFGSLSGDMDFWDLSSDQVRKVGKTNAFSTTYHEWSPDGRHILAAVLSPRLRQDNGYFIYDYHGDLVTKEMVDELYVVHWKPSTPGTFPQRPISPMKAKPASATASKSASDGKYRHPNWEPRQDAYVKAAASANAPTPTKYSASTGTAIRTPVGGSLKTPVGGNPVGGKPVGSNPVGSNPVGGNPVGGSPTGRGRGRGQQGRGQQQGQGQGRGRGGRGQPKPQNQPKKEQQADSVENPSPQPSSTPSSTPSSPPSSQSTSQPSSPQVQGNQEATKQRKNIQKKIREIEALKQKQSAGETLNEAQIAKISKENEFKDQLKSLSNNK